MTVTAMHWADLISLIMLLSALIAATGFVGMYASFAPWRSNDVGRSMMLLATALIMLIITGIFLNALGPDYPFRDQFRIFTYMVLNIALWKQLGTLLRVLNSKTSGPERERVEMPKPRKSEEEAEDKETVL